MGSKFRKGLAAEDNTPSGTRAGPARRRQVRGWLGNVTGTVDHLLTPLLLINTVIIQ